MFTLGETAALLGKEPEWLGRFVTRNPVDGDGRPYFTRTGPTRRFGAEGIERLRIAIQTHDRRPVFMYFAELVDQGCIKIGIAEDWHARLLNLQSASPHRLRRLLVLNSFVGIEPMMHQRLADLRIRGEWFRDDPRIRNFIQRCHTHSLFVIGEEPDPKVTP